MLALPVVFAILPGLNRCGCCGGVYPRGRVTEPAATPGTSVCRDCASPAAERRRRGRR